MNKPLTVGIIDYGMGNVHSVANALALVGAQPVIGSDRTLLKTADALVLPGVGTFDAAMWNLARQRLDDPIRDWILADRPFLGICLGMQLLAESSDEGSSCRGLGVIAGRVVSLAETLSAAPHLRVPHVGWNTIAGYVRPEPVEGSGRHFYFDHSYHLVCDPALVTAHVGYGRALVAAVADGNLLATQFHPEKSQRHGLALLRNFLTQAQHAALPDAWRKHAAAKVALA
jgi:glutamine amidotransferase